jgi:uncharacterized protein YndB with AHSA1/START domain
MPRSSATHDSFVVERRFAASRERVFAAWSDPVKKRRWSSCHEDTGTVEYELDFRVDGTETSRAVMNDGSTQVVKARFLDIVPPERIVYAYDLCLGDTKVSVSLVTVEFLPDGGKTTMLFTEQVVLLDGSNDLRERREGTELGLARIDAELR